MPAGLVREALVVSVAILVYFGVRNLTAGSAEAAFANARRLISLEDALGIGWEDALQSVRTAMVLGAVLPEMRHEVEALANDLSALLAVRKKIDAERDQLKH